MEHEAIYNLYPNVKEITEDSNGVITALDENKNVVSIDMSTVNTKAAELQTELETKAQAKEDLKASAKAKLIAGEPLSSEEAETIVL
jgi:hypothetical protein